MKIKVCISLVLILCLFLTGCADTRQETAAAFYYCQSDTGYGFNASVIVAEICREQIDPLDYDQLLHAYLKGPRTGSLRSPFPEGTALVEIAMQQDICEVTLSSHLAQLTGIELTLACACLTRTVSQITGYAKVRISAQNALLDNHQSITMDTNELSLKDLIQ